MEIRAVSLWTLERFLKQFDALIFMGFHGAVAFLPCRLLPLGSIKVGREHLVPCVQRFDLPLQFLNPTVGNLQFLNPDG
jgi:hypothetical protein